MDEKRLIEIRDYVDYITLISGFTETRGDMLGIVIRLRDYVSELLTYVDQIENPKMEAP